MKWLCHRFPASVLPSLFQSAFVGGHSRILFCQKVPENHLMITSKAFVAVNFSRSLDLTSGMVMGLYNHLFFTTVLEFYWLTVGFIVSNSVLFPTDHSNSKVCLGEVLKKQVRQSLWNTSGSVAFTCWEIGIHLRMKRKGKPFISEENNLWWLILLLTWALEGYVSFIFFWLKYFIKSRWFLFMSGIWAIVSLSRDLVDDLGDLFQHF